MKLRTGVGSLAIVLTLLPPIHSARVGAQDHPATSPSSSHGVLSGRVILQGPLPPEEWVPVWKHKEFCGERRGLGRHGISPSKGVANVAVVLEGNREVLPTPEHELPVVLLDNRDCEFLPRVQVTRPRALLEVRNSDHILHSAHAYLEDGRTAFHIGLPHFRDRTRTHLPEAGLLRIECDVGHTWMRAYILISSAPFTAVTGAEGAFEFRGIASGHYRLRAWHEALGEIQREVRVGKGEHVTLTLAFRRGSAK